MTFFRNAFLVMLGIALLVGFSIRYFQWDRSLYYWFSTQANAKEWRAKSIWLGDYRAVIDAHALPGVADNLSGITFDTERRQLWAVINGPSELIGISLEGEILTRHPLNGFHDVEGVVFLGDGQLAVVEERRQTVLVLPTPTESGPLQYDDFFRLRIEMHQANNKEYEGLAYDSVNDRLYIAKERSPIRLYRMEGFLHGLRQASGLAISDVTDSVGEDLFVSDLSGLGFDDKTGHLLALSDESKLLVEMKNGQTISFLSLVSGSAELAEDIPQAEGVTLDDSGRLYIISEPNLFYRFEKSTAAQPEP